MNSTQLLKENILELEKKQALLLNELKEQISDTYESFNPINIVKNTLDHAFNTPELKEKIIDSAIGLGTGFITKKILLKSTDSTAGKIIGTVLQFVVAGLVAKNTEVIKNVGKDVLQFGLNIIEKYKEKKAQNEEEESN